MKLILHIGLPKTGTTSLQQWLADHRVQLKRRGYSYPDFGVDGLENHHLLLRPVCAEASLDDGVWDPRLNGKFTSFEEIQTYLSAAIEAGNCHTMLLSTEVFTSHDAFFNDRLNGADLAKYAKDLFSIFSSVEIVICLRNQVEWLDSCYIEAVKGGHSAFSGKIDEFSLYRNADVSLDYGELLRPWLDQFGVGSIRYISYDICRKEGGLLREFIEAFGIEEDAFNVAKLDNANPRYGPISLELTRVLNSINEQLPVGQKYVSPGLVLNSESSDSVHYVSHGMAEGLIDKFSQANAELEKNAGKSLFIWPNLFPFEACSSEIPERTLFTGLFELYLKTAADRDQRLERIANDRQVELEEVREELNEDRHALSEVREELNEDRHALSEVREELNEDRHALSEVREELNEDRHALSEVRGELNAVRHHVAELEEEIHSIREEFRHLRGISLIKRLFKQK